MSKELFQSLIDEISSGNMESVTDKIAELTEEQLDALFNEVQPYKALGTASSEKLVIGSVSNLREKYLKKLITTAMVGFLFQMKDEFTVDEEQLTNPPNKEDFFEERKAKKLPEDYNTNILYLEEVQKMYNLRFPEGEARLYPEMEAALNEDDLVEVGTLANKRFEELSKPEMVFNSAKYAEALEKSIDAQSSEERTVINRFLEWLFKYDESKDTQEGHQPKEDDPERVDLQELKGTDVVYDNIPSNDTHCRFTSFYEINYEKMRDATRNIYNIKPDLEHAMIIYDVVNSQEEANSFIHKYGSTAKYDIVSFPLNTWTFMGPFKENRERVDYYNKHNAIIKQMLEQQEKDAALGEDLMKKRIRTKKTKAEKVFGKDSPAFEEYRKLNPSELENKFNAKVEETEDGDLKITREQVLNAETGEELKVDEEGVPLNALEIPVTTINAKTGETSQTRFFSESDQK